MNSRKHLRISEEDPRKIYGGIPEIICGGIPGAIFKTKPGQECILKVRLGGNVSEVLAEIILGNPARIFFQYKLRDSFLFILSNIHGPVLV